MSAEAVLAYIVDNPGATSVDLLLAHVVPNAIGTLSIIPILRTLAADGKIVADACLWREHVEKYPGAHTVGSGLIAEQATRWRLA
jgi:hypothetical protein